MERAKYAPDEIDRMISDEIARIDAANFLAEEAALPRRKECKRSPWARFSDFVRACVCAHKAP